MKNYLEKNVFNKVADPQQAKKMGKKKLQRATKKLQKKRKLCKSVGVLFLEKV